MKQLVLVVLIAATTLSVSAQKDYRNDDRDYDRYDRVYRHNKHQNKFKKREKEAFRRQLETINRRYDARINTISRSPFLGRNAKARKINQLENERRYALNECRAKFYREMDYADRGKNMRRKKW